MLHIFNFSPKIHVLVNVYMHFVCKIPISKFWIYRYFRPRFPPLKVKTRYQKHACTKIPSFSFHLKKHLFRYDVGIYPCDRQIFIAESGFFRQFWHNSGLGRYKIFPPPEIFFKCDSHGVFISELFFWALNILFSGP